MIQNTSFLRPGAVLSFANQALKAPQKKISHRTQNIPAISCQVRLMFLDQICIQAIVIKIKI
ncbi:hypothetical protein TMES_12965 [Thalassospira mesophila]|uniref:Uncharacterized protein n=1 Tax=Thalassospira mesophila TaxID=1293891 RepID=A0A1Y2KYU2_9PROT|nr:hypothetical protein TMES_12965 [Thalassospira mesophila]